MQEEYAYTVPPGHYTVLCLCIQFSFVIKISCRQVAEQNKRRKGKTRKEKESITTIREGTVTRWETSLFILSVNSSLKTYK